ncbi:MAG: NAD(P)/FAD-dependent oxidoreductase [Bacteroidales bacterium]
MKRYDVVIIGSGLGGLECAAILSKEGMSVCVLEKNGIFGGCLQSFKRKEQLLDTGMHYIGSMDKGKLLNQYFKYFGVLDRVKFRRLNNNAYDVICYKDKEYNFAQGYENFTNTLSQYFPKERDGIKCYANKIEEICSLVGVENLRHGIINRDGMEYFGIAASKMIENTVSNKVLQNVLAGTGPLYSAERNYSPLYYHAMINGSNIDGAYRIVDGSQTLADAFVNVINKNGGIVLRNCEVTRIIIENGVAKGVEINDLDRIEADYFISNVHPVPTLNLIDKTPILKKAFITRINSLRNSYGFFSVYLVMKKGTFPYLNSNYYIYKDNDVWDTSLNLRHTSIQFVLLSSQANSADEEHANVINILCPMFFSEVERWSNTLIEHRGDEYEAFKQNKAEQIIDFVNKYHPSLRACIEQIYTATPLTYRDYTATVDGSAYGIMKNCNNSVGTLISTRTKIENLFLTGQNLNVHGAIGVTLTATLTCAELLGNEYLAKKIGEA